MVKTLSKLIVTRWKGRILTARLEQGKCRSLNLEQENQGVRPGNIYIGKVKNILKNINAAFIDLGGGQTGFYSLEKNRSHRFTDDPQKKGHSLKQGDEILVQVAKEAAKTKDPVLSCYLNFAGRYVVLTLGKPQIGFSAKITDMVWKERMKKYLSELKDDSFGIIVRTNAREAGREAVGEEVRLLKERMTHLLTKAVCRTCFSLLDEAEPGYILRLRDTFSGQLEAIVTDDPICFSRIQSYLKENQRGDLNKLSLYQDPLLPLIKLYSLETVINEALGKRVWLKSGGYLVIEPTEALTVVDVNTGKYSGKKNAAETILKINLEAAVETARQLSLRNLSGIIIVDFIDMAQEEHNRLLLSRLETELLKDPVKAVLVEMTKLGLVEITRKKVLRPFHEELSEAKFTIDKQDG